MLSDQHVSTYARGFALGDRVRYVGPTTPRDPFAYQKVQGMTGTVAAVPDGACRDPRGRVLLLMRRDDCAVPIWVPAEDTVPEPKP